MKIKPGASLKVEIEIPPESAAAIEKEFRGFRRTLAWLKVLGFDTLETLLLHSLGPETKVLDAVEITMRNIEQADREQVRAPEIVEFKMLLEPHEPKPSLIFIPSSQFPCDQCVLASGPCCLDKSFCQFPKTGKTWKKHLPEEQDETA